MTTTERRERRQTRFAIRTNSDLLAAAQGDAQAFADLPADDHRRTDAESRVEAFSWVVRGLRRELKRLRGQPP